MSLLAERDVHRWDAVLVDGYDLMVLTVEGDSITVGFPPDVEYAELKIDSPDWEFAHPSGARRGLTPKEL